MKILLLGEYSNVHNTLAQGLRSLGHDVVVASNGDFWKDYPRDIDLQRKDGKLGGIALLTKVYWNLRRFRGFDIVQIINPLFFELKAERHFRIFDYLKKNNRKVVLCAFGMDYYWVKRSEDMIFRYGDFNIGNNLRHTKEADEARKDWLGTAKETLNRYCAEKSDAIVTGLYEYDACYRPCFPDKTHFIPFPIRPSEYAELANGINGKIRIFIGISKKRSEYKGTDIMLRSAQDIATKYPERVELKIAEGVPFNEYRKMMLGSDLLLDQLYSYTPAMNALEAMSHGIICVGGGEPENYEILDEKELQPIINVEPNYESVYNALEATVLNPDRIPQLKRESIEYIKRHHDFIKVALQYVELYSRI